MSDEQKQQFIASGDLISISDAATLTPYTAEYLSLLARKGKLPAVKIARNWLTSKQAITTYLAKQMAYHERAIKELQVSQGRGI